MTDWTALKYDQQLQKKSAWLSDLLAEYSDHKPQVFASNEHSYRMRAEFRIWHEADEINYAMYEKGTKQTYSISDFPPAASPIRELMPRLIDKLRQSEILKRRLFTVEFLSTTTSDVLVCLIYHKKLDEQWIVEAEKLKIELGIELIGRAKKQKIVLGNDYLTETLKTNQREFKMRQIEGSFTQPNAQVNEKMVRWACIQAEEIAQKRKDSEQRNDLLELYCGNGNFTLPLSYYFDRVLTTEVSKTSIAALNWNIDANQVDNINNARLSAEEATQALDKVREFRRLREIELDSYEFSTIFVDPPRAGVDQKTMELVRRFDNIIYISCNPETLADNISQINDTHRVCKVAAFDQFPFTPHLEAGIVLKRRS